MLNAELFKTLHKICMLFQIKVGIRGFHPKTPIFGLQEGFSKLFQSHFDLNPHHLKRESSALTNPIDFVHSFHINIT